MGCRKAVDYRGDCEAEGVELGGVSWIRIRLGGREIGGVLRFGGETGVGSGRGVVPGLGVVQGGRGRRLAGVPSILLRLVRERDRFLRFEARWRLGRRPLVLLLCGLRQPWMSLLLGCCAAGLRAVRGSTGYVLFA